MSMTRARGEMAALALCIGLGTWASAQQEAGTLTVPFSDPNRPGRLRVEVLQGTINVRGADRRDVAIDVRGGSARRALRPPNPPGGLRRLNQGPSFTVDEDGNELRVESPSFNRPLDIDVQVPRRTNLTLSSVNGGGITVEGVEGDLEIEHVNGPVTLTDVAGSVVANSVNGPVRAVLTRVTAQKVMAFTSLNGTVDVTLPSSVKATFLLRSDRGDVFTDFDLDIRPTPAQREETRRRNGRYRLEVNRAITGLANGGGPEVELRSFNGSVYLRKGS